MSMHDEECKPIPLNKLRKKDKTPVWLWRKSDVSEWSQIEHCAVGTNTFSNYKHECFLAWFFREEYPAVLKIEDYSKTWLAYENKPEWEASS